MSQQAPAPPKLERTTSPPITGGLPSPDESPKSTFSGVNHLTPGPPGPDMMTSVQELLSGMKGTVATLTQTFEALQSQTLKVAEVGGTVNAAQEVKALGKHLVGQDKRQEEQIAELKTLIQEVLVAQIAEQMRMHLREIIRTQVAPRVKVAVAEQLQTQFPAGLEDTLDAHRKQLNLVKQCLQNAESRRINALIRASELNQPLRPLLMENGKPSEHLPSTLAGIFSLPPKSVLSLMLDYKIPYVQGESREKIFNRIMQFLGIGFQMVPTSKSRAETPLLTTTT
ncbi:hypothetical protein M407DRAFT_240861 [Tulasnella calospora MUT 4182]|uniref:Uncharacterized protein n=1 Tax=Tulasnella calospora MUT 4182 TaxID=1051891 RepID=A0A0C3MJW6_9AGAM|nr:hypothetical protein M407DRAFT_240861 [Tulasnella calospora MUT 4182]